jgi:hypothetical protein
MFSQFVLWHRPPPSPSITLYFSPLEAILLTHVYMYLTINLLDIGNIETKAMVGEVGTSRIEGNSQYRRTFKGERQSPEGAQKDSVGEIWFDEAIQVRLFTM